MPASRSELSRWQLDLTWSDADLDAPSAYPFGEEAGLTFAHTVAWVNAELMKNVSEIGQLRMQRRAA